MKFRAIERNKGQYLTVMYDVNFKKDRIRGKTNISINRDYIKSYNPLSLKVVKDFTQSEKLEVLGELNAFYVFVEKTMAKLKRGSLLDACAKLREEIEIYFGRTLEAEEDKEMELFEFIDYYTNLKRNQVVTKNGIVKETNKGLIQQYIWTKRLLKEYVDDNSISFGYKSVNNNFYTTFTNYLQKQGYAINTIGKFFKNLKMFMNKSHIDGHHNNLKFKGFKIIKEKVDNQYLTSIEIQELFNKRSELSGAELHRIDYFLLMAYTSLRVGDMLRLRKKNIIFDEIPLIEFMESKNSKSIYFRITPEVQTILNSYDGGFPNDVIKQKITTTDRINETLRRLIKHKKITSHCGRRSYVNNEIIKGTPYADIMRQTGHDSREAFNSYVSRCSDKELLKARARREFD